MTIVRPRGPVKRSSLVGVALVALVLSGCATQTAGEASVAGEQPLAAATPFPVVGALTCPDGWPPDWAIPGQAADGQLLPDGRVTTAILCDYGAGPVADSVWALVEQQDLTTEAQRRIDVAYGRATALEGSRGLVAASLPLLLVMGRLDSGAEFRTLSWSGYAEQPPWTEASADVRRDIVHTNGETTCFYTFDQSAAQWRECPPDPVSGP